MAYVVNQEDWEPLLCPFIFIYMNMIMKLEIAIVAILQVGRNNVWVDPMAKFLCGVESVHNSLWAL